ncbi:isocitrate lyase/PEP mutase family protein [Pedobacter caeni]|uniref:2-Methylisocitrate lyase, PEP mutase family n=1 Tax=Pedobacter caeni TaxID=288992 RepID=A0A1M4URS9_9SPHI|nr:isocitrate lyase/phosphoenolpyruvate mutase family protein [Pedobacter caeni]SHE59368.1 2-Methylisocitrate lyase, PEP mutase family [Pedobacter caeni]
MINHNQIQKAETFREQHLSEKLLLLANVWDTLSARLIATLGFPSIATASAAMALSNGYKDGENIPFKHLLNAVKQIVEAVDVPVTVDFERGFTDDISQLKEHIGLLIETGAVGLNIEDGKGHGKGLLSIEEQCKKIEAIRAVAVELNVPIVINARTDIYLQPYENNRIEKVIERANAYQAAGADAVYPILIDNYKEISTLKEMTTLPINVFLLESIGNLKQLEELGVSRVSVGPAMINGAITKMKQLAEGLLNYETHEFYSQKMVSNDFLDKLI